MPQVIEGGRGIQERLEDFAEVLGGKGLHEIAKSKLEIQRARQRVDQEGRAFAMGVEDRTRKMRQEDEEARTQRAFDLLDMLAKKRGILSQEQAGRDAKTLGEVSPFQALLARPDLPQSARTQLEGATATYGKLETPAARKLLIEETLPAVQQSIDLEQREAFKKGLGDRLARGAYGEDESVAEGLKQLQEAADSGAPMQQLVAMDTKLRTSMAEANAKLAKKQRLLAYATQQASVLPPGPAADKAERAVHDFNAELIDEKGLQQALMEAQFGEDTAKPKAPKSRPELYVEAAKLAKEGVVTANPQELLAATETIFNRLVQLQEEESQQGQPQQRQRSPGSNQPGGLPFEQSGQDTSTAPAAPGPVQAVEQARELTGESAIAPASDPAIALKKAEEAARSGASDEELRAILTAAGIDPDAPASTLEEPKKPKKRRQAERVGTNF